MSFKEGNKEKKEKEKKKKPESTNSPK